MTTFGALLHGDLAQHTAWITRAAADSSGSDINGFAFLFLLLGFLFYGLMFVRYRNVDKRHRHETETNSTMANVQAQDAFHQSLTGLSNSKMRGANNKSVRGSLSSWF